MTLFEVMGGNLRHRESLWRPKQESRSNCIAWKKVAKSASLVILSKLHNTIKSEMEVRREISFVNVVKEGTRHGSQVGKTMPDFKLG